MEENQGQKRIALLVDAENTRSDLLEFVLSEISTYGNIISKRAYGDWTASVLKKWPETLNRLAIQPIQQFSYTKGKNSSDSALIIDAMDLLYTRKFDTFVIVSSDSDFTRLVTRLRDDEIFVIGVGEEKTPESLVRACNDFIYLENLDTVSDDEEESKEKENAVSSRKEREMRFNADKKKIVSKLKRAAEKLGDDEGWTEISRAGDLLKRQDSAFNTRNYGFSSLVKMIESLTKSFEIARTPGKGKSLIIEYRIIQKNDYTRQKMQNLPNDAEIKSES